MKLLCVKFLFLAVPKCPYGTEQKANVHVRKERNAFVLLEWLGYNMKSEQDAIFPTTPLVSVRVLCVGKAKMN